MIVISIVAFIATLAVIVRSLLFCRISHRQRRDDRAEVARMAAISVVQALGILGVWVIEPWRLDSMSIISSLFMSQTIVVEAYFFHRIDSMIVGRERREGERRAQPARH